MKSYIYWMFFLEDDQKLIRNERNNENWPTVNNYTKLILEDWIPKINQQQSESKDIVAINNEIRQLMANVRTWFINEYNLLGKPAKRTLLDKERELRKLERELEIIQYNLDHPKQKLEEYEKDSLLTKIQIQKRRIGNCKDELEETKKDYENEKKELSQRLSYERKDLEPFLDEPEEYTDPITRELKIHYKHYSEWWRIFHDIHPYSSALKKLKNCIAEWYDYNEGKGPEPNPYEIYVEEKTDDSITFLWKPVEQELEMIDKDGELVKKKGKFFSFLNNYFFNYHGEWFEVIDYRQETYNLVTIIAQKSIFYNNYFHVVKADCNGILHHSPISITEICSCPNFDQSDFFQDFLSDYKLSLCLYKTEVSSIKQTVVGEGESKFHGKPDALPLIHGIGINRVGKTLTEIENEIQNNLLKRFLNDLWNKISGISFGGLKLGSGQDELGILYYLLNDKIGEFQDYKSRAVNEKYGWFEPLEKDGKIKNELDPHTDINKTLNKWGLTDENGEVIPFMSHFLYWHVKANLYWRKKQIWEGRYWMLHEQGMRVIEVCNASGNTITIVAYGLVLTKFTENITAKLVLSPTIANILNVAVDVSLKDDKSQNLRQSERTVVSQRIKPDGEIINTESKTSSNSVAKGKSRVRVSVPSPIPLLLGNDHTKSEYTFLQFQDKWISSGKHPLGLRIQFNKILLNQYRNKKELKGKMAYDYFNTKSFGELLNNEGFLKASIISWNLACRNADWFRGKIENGVFLYEDDHKNFYQKQISSPLNFANKGAIIRGTFNAVYLRSNIKSLPGDDFSTATDGMSWVYKNGSNCSKEDGTGDVFPQLITDGKKHIKIDAPDHSTSNCSYRYCTKSHEGSWRFSADAVWQSKWINLDKDKLYFYNFRTFSKNANWSFKPLDLNCKISLAQNGSNWELKTEGTFEFYNSSGDLDGVPKVETKIEPTDLPTKKSNPLDPRVKKVEKTLIFAPVAGGEKEPNVPDIDNSPDPDFPPDPDPGQDPDPTKDPDPTIDPEIPPDISPDDPDYD